MTRDQIRSIYYKLKLKTITIVITTVCGSYVTQVACVLVPVYTNQERNTQAKGDSPHLSEGVPDKITLIRLKSREFGQMEEGESHLEDGHGA